MSVYAVRSRLRDIREYKGERTNKSLCKFKAIPFVSDEDVNTVTFVLDALSILPDSKEENEILKIYTKFLVQASYYGYKVDKQYWVYYSLLKR